jgi:protein-S-isoprenylcysteine O-methyltransferase Ste14
LFYLDPRGTVMALSTGLGAGLTVGTPKSLFPGLLEENGGRQYDVSPDGERFILDRDMEAGEKPIVVMVGAAARLAFVAYLAGTSIRTSREERLLHEAFGAEYDEYARRVPAVLPRFVRRGGAGGSRSPGT